MKLISNALTDCLCRTTTSPPISEVKRNACHATLKLLHSACRLTVILHQTVAEKTATCKAIAILVSCKLRVQNVANPATAALSCNVFTTKHKVWPKKSIWRSAIKQQPSCINYTGQMNDFGTCSQYSCPVCSQPEAASDGISDTVIEDDGQVSMINLAVLGQTVLELLNEFNSSRMNNEQRIWQPVALSTNTITFC